MSVKNTYNYPIFTVRWLAIHALAVPTIFFLGSITAIQFIQRLIFIIWYNLIQISRVQNLIEQVFIGDYCSFLYWLFCFLVIFLINFLLFMSNNGTTGRIPLWIIGTIVGTLAIGLIAIFFYGSYVGLGSSLLNFFYF